ncbi:DUF2057 domain-containing protein [Acinetobacter qingfengensis]|uniref:Uncharacterized protein n=1 Tax=Acinetobacter qingfengensis TaxID=1262585 RepID=A0A1E7RDM1_9GAMM|nr:DUF2057 family protein [Acinetobacter qingfengensis]KAA8735348.1 DUF2057 domain-containing protein [Acinetobacter qingfengensis]OEY97327.1 hypothetical protein BJI46_10610 [Acinetobacter qingfengensis]
MLKKFLSVISLSVLSVSAWADVVLTAPEEIIVLAIDDQEVSKGLISKKNNSFKLDAGVHSISVKYQDIFYHASGEHDVLKSNILTLNQVPLQDGQSYKLVLVNPPKDFDQAKEFAERPTIAIQNQSGQKVAEQVGASQQNKSWLGQNLFGAVTDLRKDKPQATVVYVPEAHAQVTSAQNATNVAGNQLIELWKKATSQQRKEFTAWLTEQASR